jgi:hypothetical protein
MILKRVFDLIETNCVILIVDSNFFEEQFNDLVGAVSSMRNSTVRSIRVAVAAFLAKMRLGLSNRVLAVLFHLKNKCVVSRIIAQVRTSLMKDFVPLHLGFQHIDHQAAIDHHQTATATILHTTKPDQLCVVADSTYLFIQKSMNNEFQRRSYSVHKHRNLVKPMILTTTVSFPDSYEWSFLRFILI